MRAPTAPRSRRPLVVGGAVAAALLLAAAVLSLPGVRRGVIDPAGRDPVPATRVEAGDDFWEYFAFSPSVIEVPQGATVTWTFTSAEAEHNVVFDDLASPTQLDGTWSRTFDRPGSHPYTCTLHDGMDGRVEVLPR